MASRDSKLVVDRQASWIAPLLLAFGSACLFWLMTETSRYTSGDPFDSPLYWWTWLLLPTLAFVDAAAVPEVPPSAWTAALCLPQAVGVALVGTVFHDIDDGASLWLVGELFVLAQAAVVVGAAGAGNRSVDASGAERP